MRDACCSEVWHYTVSTASLIPEILLPFRVSASYTPNFAASRAALSDASCYRRRP